MNATPKPAAPSPVVAARERAIQLEHLSLSHVDGVMRLANAEAMVRYTLDDLTEARAQIEAQKDRIGEMSISLEACCDENARSRMRINKIAYEADIARELIRSGRVAEGMTMLAEIIAIAEAK